MSDASIGDGETMPAFLRMAAGARARVRAGLLLGLYVVCAVVFAGGTMAAAQALIHLHIEPNTLPPIRILLTSQALLACAVVLAPTALLLAITHDRPVVFGWGAGGRLRQLGLGAATGLAAMALLIGAIWAVHGASLHPAVSSPGQVIGHAVGYLLVFGLVAVLEEGFLRGYPLVLLSRAISFPAAAVVTSVVFALLHAGHASETPIGLAQVALVGLVLAYSLGRSGGLWFAWGWHAAWDWAETFLFGAPDSGLPARGSLLVTDLHGPAWLSGGSAGPEGSVLVTAVLAFTVLVIRFALTRPPVGTARARS